MLGELAALFRRHAKNPAVHQHTDSELARRLQELLDTCRAAWPSFEVPADVFVRHLAERLPDRGDLDSCLSRLRGPELYLACGCVENDPAALAAFDADVMSQVAPVLHRMGLSTSLVDDVVQVMRTKLLVADEPGLRPLLASYAGRGPLVGWVRTAARRTALSLLRNKDEQIGGASESHVVEDMPLSVDMELDYIKGRYHGAFQQAVEDAITTLEAEQLGVLRLHYMNGLSIDRIAAILGVHRATAARRLRAASDAVRDEARRLLHARLKLSTDELDSLAGLVQSLLHLSLDRLLGSR